MKVNGKNEDRDKMAVELYFSVLRAKKAKGIPHKEAKGYAYDAVELRFNISPKRLKNIIYDNHSTLNCDKNLFVEENRRLVQTLKEANASMEEIIEHNQKATSCMKETIDCNNELIKVLEEIGYV